MTYKEIKPETWTPENPEDFIEGVLINTEFNVGESKSKLYHLEVSENPISVWGSVILDKIMLLTKPGDKLRITYKGLAEQKDLNKNPAKIFKVERDRD